MVDFDIIFQITWRLQFSNCPAASLAVYYRCKANGFLQNYGDDA